jgi:hypothetical protein
MQFFYCLPLLCALVASTPLALPAAPAQPGGYESNQSGYLLSPDYTDAVFRIEDAKSRVSIASVNLSVGDLSEVNGQLVGDYTIEVPLMQSKNDRGRIILPLSTSIAELGRTGGTLIGQSISHKENTSPNKIVCQVIPQKDQTILLAITTDQRTIKFTSRYKVIGLKNDG